MGNACSTDDGIRVAQPKQRAAHARSPATTANPLTPSSGTTATTDPTATDQQHTAPLASTQPATGNTATAETRRADRMAAAHRSVSVVARADMGYELPEPPLAEHLGRIERRAAIAISVHGLTADPRQFTPEAVPAATIARSVERCREWLVEVLPLYSSCNTTQ